MDVFGFIGDISMAEKSLNKHQIIGRLGKDPELRYTTNGTAVTTHSVATADSYKDAQGNLVETTEWHRVIAWGKLGEICGQYLNKGSKVYFEGKSQTKKWTDKQGVERYTTELIARDMILLGDRGEGGNYPPHPADQEQGVAPQSFSSAPATTGPPKSQVAGQDSTTPPDDKPF